MQNKKRVSLPAKNPRTGRAAGSWYESPLPSVLRDTWPSQSFRLLREQLTRWNFVLQPLYPILPVEFVARA
jgi:hypothetical protein